MLLIPAIDIKDGKCVRLKQGDMSQETIYSDNPVVLAEKWIGAGARRLHIVDLNGASDGKPVNSKIIHEIVDKFPDVPIQVGGGIRDEDTIQEYLNAGVRYVILGTKAVTSPHFVSDVCVEFPGHIIVALDVREGKVAIDGWSKLSRHDALDLAQHFEVDGVATVIYTDIGRDGMMTGLNINATLDFAKELTIPVIASGGVMSIEDISALCAVYSEGIDGAIIGRAIYEGVLDFSEAQSLADKLCADPSS